MEKGVRANDGLIAASRVTCRRNGNVRAAPSLALGQRGEPVVDVLEQARADAFLKHGRRLQGEMVDSVPGRKKAWGAGGGRRRLLAPTASSGEGFDNAAAVVPATRHSLRTASRSCVVLAFA